LKCCWNRRRSIGSSEHERIGYHREICTLLSFINSLRLEGKKNFIKRLKNDANQWVEGTDMLKPIVFDYFSNLFTSEVQAVDPALLEKILPRVIEEMNIKLRAPFTAEEVKKAAFSIGDFKAPGPDGIHAVFYKRF
jgi:hypothetical protein